MTAPARTRWFPGLVRFAFRAVMGLLWVGLSAWSAAAIYYSNLPTGWLRTGGAVAFALAAVVGLLCVRPWWRAWLALLAGFAVIVAWFLVIPPSNDRDWQPDLAVLPYAEIKGDRVTIHHIRNCDYRSETDYTPRYYDRTFDLAGLQSVDLFLVHWGSPAIAHTMVSFGFADGAYLCFSIETRKEKGEDYSTIQGFFRRYELTYIVADERDLVRLRTNFRGEQVYLYRLRPDPAKARSVLLDYLGKINRLKETPEWYNVVTDNCTTGIHQHTYPYFQQVPFDWRILINGYVDELLYERGALDQTRPFAELHARSLVNGRAKVADQDPAFSARIREGLPGMTR